MLQIGSALFPLRTSYEVAVGHFRSSRTLTGERPNRKHIARDGGHRDEPVATQRAISC